VKPANNSPINTLTATAFFNTFIRSSYVKIFSSNMLQ
jgi:hypothetical protein